jgi:hypothetical protein
MTRLEAALGVPLPYFDWAAGGIPQACSQPTYTNSNGEQVPNPLYAGPKPDGSMTSRGSGGLPTGELRDLEVLAMSRESFSDFSNTLEDAHNTVHGAIGGEMASISFSSFDPIFWFHHQVRVIFAPVASALY